MRLTCTACGAHGSIEQFTADSDARRFAEIVAALPANVGPVAIRYLGLFRPGKRGLSWDRACKLMVELAGMIERGAVERHGRSIPAAPPLFANAMQQMLDRRETLDLPLTTHGYLITIVAGEAPRAEARAEAAQQGQPKHDDGPRPVVNTVAIAELSSEIAFRKRIGKPEMTAQEKANFLARHGASNAT